MGAILDDLWDHEGYGARRLPDGTLTATWSEGTSAFDAYVAACSCGWHGGEHPSNKGGHQSALEEWEADHARPLLAETVPASVATAIADAKQAIGRLVRERPAAAVRALDDLGSWSGVVRERLAAPDATRQAADRMRARLEGLDPQATRRPIAR
jgi:hypothetical protein